MRKSAAPPLRLGLGDKPASRPTVARAAWLSALASLVVIGSALAWIALPDPAIAAAGFAAAALVSAWWLVRKRGRAAKRELVSDARGLFLCESGRPERPIVLYCRPFGITLFASRTRDRLALALTTALEVTYIGAVIHDEERGALGARIAAASTVPDDEALLDAMGTDGRPLLVTARALDELCGHLCEMDARALGRCLLSDARGVPIVLDGTELFVGKKAFDLAAPLEWRGSLFRESFGSPSGGDDSARDAPPSGGVIVYHATWIRQGPSETVLVSLWRPLATDRQPRAGSTPPSDVRVGIDRASMVRLQAALDRAPRARSEPPRVKSSSARR
jgi:hypothetical protein